MIQQWFPREAEVMKFWFLTSEEKEQTLIQQVLLIQEVASVPGSPIPPGKNVR